MLHILGFAASLDDRHVLHGALTELSHTIVSDWTAYKSEEDRSSCAVLLIPDLRASGLSRFKLVHNPSTPTVLITASDPTNLRAAAGVPVDEILFLHELDELPDTVKRVCVSRVTLPVLDVLGRSAPGILAVAKMALDPRATPVLSVNALARRLGLDRQRLWDEWTSGWHGQPPLSLKAFVSWALLIRAHNLKMEEMSWASVSAKLHVTLPTLTRTARRLTGLSLRKLSARIARTLACKARGSGVVD